MLQKADGMSTRPEPMEARNDLSIPLPHLTSI